VLALRSQEVAQLTAGDGDREELRIIREQMADGR
jgi:hypothetical protein